MTDRKLDIRTDHIIESLRTHRDGVFQADPFAADFGKEGFSPGFEGFLRVIDAEAKAWAKPVLLVHADEHRYRLDVGIQLIPGEEKLANITRVGTFGDKDVHAVLVTVDPASPQLFDCGPLIVPGNTAPNLPVPASVP